MRGSFRSIMRIMCGIGLGIFLVGCPLTPAENNGDGDGTGTGNGDGGGSDGGTESKLAVFEDPDSDFTTSDVHDVDDQIVQFDTDNNSIVWAETGVEFQTGQWAVNGNFPEPTMFFQVRFGTVDGERRAYFTEAGPATICDIRVSGSILQIFATSVMVPQE